MASTMASVGKGVGAARGLGISKSEILESIGGLSAWLAMNNYLCIYIFG